MKKLILVVGILLFLTACSSVSRYRNVSDIITGLYSSEAYDSKGLSANDNAQVIDFLRKLKHDNYLYNIEDYMNYMPANKANLPNSTEVLIVDNKCHVAFDKLNFEVIAGEDGLSEAVVICKGYYVNLSRDYFTPAYDELIKNPVYDYRYVDYIKEGNTYKFMYESRYDETGFSVYIKELNGEISEITTVFERITIPSKSTRNYLFTGIIIILTIGVLVYLMKIKKKQTNQESW